MSKKSIHAKLRLVESSTQTDDVILNWAEYKSDDLPEIFYVVITHAYIGHIP